MALYKRGSIYWVSFTDPSGKQIRRSSGTTDRAQAQQFFDKLKYESWQQAKLGEKKRRTWDEAALKWLEEKQTKKSIVSDISMIRYLTAFLRGRYLDEITRGEIMGIAERKKAESSPSRANRYLALIRSIFNRAMKIWEWIDKTPHVSLYREPKVRVRYLTTPEIHRLMRELPDHLKRIFQFAIMTGLRKANILGLRWSQVDFIRKQIVIDGTETKAGNTLVVQITPAIESLLVSLIKIHPVYVFTYKGNRMRDIGEAWNKALKRAGISDFRFHDCRHTWASILRQSGVALDVLQEMGGWSSESMVKRYAHLAPQQINKTASIVDNVFSEKITFLSH